jgi:hypothetical protein
MFYRLVDMTYKVYTALLPSVFCIMSNGINSIRVFVSSCTFHKIR